MSEIMLNSSEPEIADIYPLSPMQQGMLFLALNAPGTGMYVEQVTYTLRGELDVAAFERAWQHAAARHTTLRTSLLWEDAGEPLQIVEQEVSVPFRHEDLRGLTRAEQQRCLRAYQQDDRTRGFDLTRAPLFRLALFRVEESAHRVVFTHHHVILDGWSIAVLLDEVLAAYGAYARGKQPQLPEPRPYREYIEWIASKDQGAAEAFWRERLDGFTEPTLVKLPQAVKPVEGHKEELRITLPDELGGRLSELMRRAQVTLNTIVQGAWALLLSRYTGKQQLIFGATVSGRPHDLHGVESMIGLFINTIPVPVHLRSVTVTDFLRHLQRQQADSYAYQYARLSDIHTWSEVSAGQPLFDTLVVFENYPTAGTNEAVEGGETNGGFTVSGEESWERVNYPVALVASGSSALRLRLAFDEGVIGRAVAEGMLRHLVHLLEAMAQQPAALVTQLPMLAADERQAILELGRGAESSGEAVRVEELIAQRARLQPEAIAVSDGTVSYSYAELQARAEQLARRLRRAGIRAEDVVGVLLPRSADAVCALLGVWRAGGAYLPLEATYPRERLAAMVADSGARCIVSRTEMEETLRGVSGSKGEREGEEGQEDSLSQCQRVWIDDLAADSTSAQAEEDERASSDKQIDIALSTESLAYVIYTSGSTGRPKGVGITHAGLCNLVRWHVGEYGISAADRMTQIASLSFDAAGWEVWPALSAGARVEIVPEGVRGGWGELGQWMREREITVSFLPTPVAEEMLNAGVEFPPTLRLLSVGGDRLRRWANARAHYELANIYGPTEITIASNCGMVATQGAGLPPLGRAIAGTRVYVLDAAGELCPVGVAGELYVGGAGVARGYVKRPELTAEKFVPDAFSGVAGARLYRTGDVVSWRADGQLDFHGRQDAQVKLRGHRIELGEIESVLSKFAGVRQCAVTISELAGTQTLLAYFAGEPEAAELRAYAARQLPAYMIPQRFIKLDALPLTPNGKLDRKALPAPAETDTNLFAAPQTPTQEILCGIWSEVLGRERIGIHDNFFELGGDSILSIQVVARAAQFGLTLTTRDLFERQTVELLSEVACDDTATSAQAMPEGEVPLTPIQHWFMQQARRRPSHFNHAVLLADATNIDGARLQRVVERVLASHEVFRLRYERDAQGQVRQHYRGNVDSNERRCGRADLRALPPVVQSKVVETIAGRMQESLELEAGRLVSALRCEVTSGGRLLVVAHHLVIDGVSWRILLDQVERAYADAQIDAERSFLRTHGSSFGQWAQALTREAASEETQGELAYWMTQQPQADERLPRDYEAGENTVESSESIAVEFDAEQTEVLLREVPRRLRAQVEETLMLGVVEALREWSGGREVIVECEGHGREPLAGVDVSQTVGWFTTLFPVRFVQTSNSETQGTDETTITERLGVVRDQLRGVPRKGLGYGLLKYVATAAALRDAQAEVSFNYLGQWDANLGGLFEPCAEGVGASQWAGERRSHVVGVNGSVHGGRLRVVWTYSRNLHRRETIERVASVFRRSVEAVIAACGDESVSAAPAPVEVSDLSFSDAEWKALLTAVRS